MTAAAVETHGLTKEFEKGRRTIWQRVRREPDRRERFRATERYVRVHGTVAQH